MAYKLRQMDETQVDSYEGAIKLRQEEGNEIDMKESSEIYWRMVGFTRRRNRNIISLRMLCGTDLSESRY